MDALADPVERVADTGSPAWSGSTGTARAGRTASPTAAGRANTVDTRFAIASGTRGLTALTVVGLIEDGCPART